MWSYLSRRRINNKNVHHDKDSFGPKEDVANFIKNYKMKIILMNNLNEKILAQHTKTHENYELKPTKNVHVPLMDKISMKKIKYEIKIKKFLLNIKLY